MAVSSSPSRPCPRCGKAALIAPSNAFRPFCTEKCRLIDLGAWLSEDYRIAGQTVSTEAADESSSEEGSWEN